VRKPVSLAALLLAVLSVLFFVNLHHAPRLIAGRLLQGVGAGALIEYGPSPRQLAFVIALGLIVLAMLMVLRSRETMARKRGGLRSLRPHFTLPASARKAYPLAACTFICTWALEGFF